MSLSVRPTTGPAPQAIIERGPGPELGDGRLDRLRQPWIIASAQVDDLAEAASGLADERKAHVGAAGVADERGEREGEVRHWKP